MFFVFIRELDVPQLGESNLKGPRNFVEVKFFTRAFFWAGTTLMMTLCALFLPFKLTTLYEPKMRERYLQVMNGRIYVFEGLLFGSKILLLIAM